MNKSRILTATLVNDTSVLNHYGCKLVVKNIFKVTSKYSINIIHTVSVGKNWENDTDKINILRSDLVLVNGEGTIHHSKRRALILTKVATFCKELKKPCFLINCVYQENNNTINEHVRKFMKIYARESLTQQELEKIGIKSIIVPDMTFYDQSLFKSNNNTLFTKGKIYSGSTYLYISNLMYLNSQKKYTTFVTISNNKDIKPLKMTIKNIVKKLIRIQPIVFKKINPVFIKKRILLFNEGRYSTSNLETLISLIGRDLRELKTL
ncbi:hypothetical protein [Thiolinea disciformis]|uniref:hypothetical protein n=1 Tax=Thiolinea disciformis TaxID=125614 RepID=UPI0003A1D7E7|nr:hypothetical protein [Thiolinea disciformis]